MTDLLPTGEEPEELEPEALAPELDDLGLDLSEEDQAEVAKMVEHLREQFGETEEPAEVVAQEPEPEPEPVEEPEPFVATTPEYIEVDGRQVPVAEARSLIDLRNYLNANPEKAQEVRQVIEGKKPETEPEPPKPPEWLDQDDPAQMAMWTRQTELENQIKQIAGNQNQIAQQQSVARATADAESGISTFRALHPELTEGDIHTLRLHAVGLEIIDGLAKTRSGPDAVLKALDIAYWDHPEFRARATAEPSPAKQKAAERAEKKSKLNALGGSSGSVARTESKPDLSTERGSREAAAQWLREQNILQ